MAEECIHSGTEFHRDQSLPLLLTFIAELEEERSCHCSDSWILASDHRGPSSILGAFL
jgi:hypothetical protein